MKIRLLLTLIILIPVIAFAQSDNSPEQKHPLPVCSTGYNDSLKPNIPKDCLIPDDDSGPLVPVQIKTKSGRYIFDNQAMPITEVEEKDLLPPPPQQPPYPFVEEVPPEVLINGKPASKLTDEEIAGFLASKNRSVFVEDGSVEIVRIAPGYSTSIAFSEPIQYYTMGDPHMFIIDQFPTPPQKPSIISLKALVRNGDTNLQVFFEGNKMRTFHLFIEPNFTTADGAVLITPFPQSSQSFIPNMSFIYLTLVLAITALIAMVFLLLHVKKRETKKT